MSNKEYLDEAEVGTYEFELLEKIIEERDNFVLQCPAMSSMIHRIPDSHEVLVVFMRRFVSQIIQSEKRVKWNDGPVELQRYQRIPELESTMAQLASPAISEVVYYCWDQYQRKQLPHTADLRYDSLSSHPLWVDKSERWDFTDRQWKIEIMKMPGISRIGGMVGD